MPTGVYVRTKKARENIAKARREYLAKYPNSMKHLGKKISMKVKGRPSPMKGRHHSKKAKKLIAKSSKEHWNNPAYSESAPTKDELVKEIDELVQKIARRFNAILEYLEKEGKQFVDTDELTGNNFFDMARLDEPMIRLGAATADLVLRLTEEIDRLKAEIAKIREDLETERRLRLSK